MERILGIDAPFTPWYTLDGLAGKGENGLNKPKIMVAMSGGVDSSAAAALLMEQGFPVCGATLRLFTNEDIGIRDQSRTCCSLKDVEDARAVAEKLGISHYVFDFGDRFREAVIQKFGREYAAGRTPNPCIDCNRYIKFGRLLEQARRLEYDAVATGHYARVEQDKRTGRWLLKKAADSAKDQTYVLYALTQDQLSHTLFPLGSMAKAAVRVYAEQKGLVNARKPDSQDICFVRDGNYAEFLENTLHISSPAGAFIDPDGHEIGRHHGIVRYTIGQRKGLGVAFGEPRFVVAKDAQSNTVVLGKNEDLYSRTLEAEDINLISLPDLTGPLRATVKARYKQSETPATLEPLGDSRIRVIFDEPQRALTPGQAVVFYRGDTVVGGGTIT